MATFTRTGLVAVVAAAGATACGGGGGGDGPDAAPPPVEVEVRVVPIDDLGGQVSTLAPFTLTVDGQVVAPYQAYRTTAASAEVLLATDFTVEMRAGELQVDGFVVHPPWLYFPEQPPEVACPRGPLTGFAVDLCGYGNGELRYASVTLRSDAGACIGDGFCTSCRVGGCSSGLKCGTSFADRGLTYSRLACVPSGSRDTDQTCTWTAGGDGRWVDDCGAGRVCFEGTCRARCPASCATAEVCTHLPGHPLEIEICLPRP